MKYAVTATPAIPATSIRPTLPSGVPCQLWKKSGFGCDGNYPTALGCLPYQGDCSKPDTDTLNTVHFVVQRLCEAEQPAASTHCDMMQPKVSMGTTNNEVIPSGVAGPYPLYRVTVRVDGPNNSVAFVQAMVRGDGS